MGRDMQVQRLTEKLKQDTIDLPIIDFHNHLQWKEILQQRKFENITQLWIRSDPYKHRLMRIMGVSERRITGDSNDWEKFLSFCEVFPYLVGTPVYDWSLEELRQVFDCDLLPSATNARQIWEWTNFKLQDEAFSADRIVMRFSPEYLAPCCSIVEDITALQNSEVLAPSLRGDDISRPTRKFICELEQISGKAIFDFNAYLEAVEIQIRNFHRAGCRFSDHALDSGFRYIPNDSCARNGFLRILDNKDITDEQAQQLASTVLLHVSRLYAKYGWTIQLHIGALRTTSSRLRNLAGAAGGYSAIGMDYSLDDITRYLNDLEQLANGLPKIILYTLNPAHNAAFATLSGSFSTDGMQSVVCQGPAWWWCDHKYGIRQMLDNYASYSVLSTLVGMTTDSRSILSVVRHRYFREIACWWMSEKIVSGDFRCDLKIAKEILTAIFYQNAKKLINDVC